MRPTRALLLVILVAIAARAPSTLGKGTAPACAGPLPCLGARLPAPITLTSNYAPRTIAYRIGRDGRVNRVPSPQSPFPRGASWFPFTGTWYMIRQGHLVVGRGRKPLWRSHDQIAANRIGLVAAGSYAVAFQHDHKLYLAPFGGTERAVARREEPLGWTTGGLFAYGYRGRQLLLRSLSGALVDVVARQPLGSDYFVTNGSLYFISHGVLMSAHGTRVRRLASLKHLGVSTNVWLQPLGRLVELQDDRRVVVVRADGSMFAWTRLPISHDQTGTISSSLVAAPNLASVAFTAAFSRSRDPQAGGSYATEIVYVLPAGATTAIPIHRGSVQLAVCERGAVLEWHGKWLLYSNTEGSLAAIETTGPDRAIELRSLVRGLPGLSSSRDSFTASWSRVAG